MNLSALQSPEYRLYMIGNVFGMNANWILRLVIGWLAWDLTKSASFVGLVSFLNFAPVLLGGPIFGVITDRVDLKKAAVLVQLSIASLALILCASLAVKLVDARFIAIYAVVIGLALSAYQPVRLSLGPRLVRPERISSVVGLGALNFNISRLTGPALGGVLIANIGVTWTIFVVCVLYIPFLLILSRLNPRKRSDKTIHLPFWKSFKQGVAVILSHRIMLIAFTVTGLFSVVVRGSLEILPIIADGVFAKGAVGLGILTAAAGAGALLASLIQIMVSPVVKGRVPTRALLATTAGTALTLALGITHSWPVSIALIAGIGFTSTIVGVNFQSLVQMHLDDDIRGRVMSLWMTVAVGGTALGALTLGILIDAIGISLTLGGVGGASLLVFLAFLPRIRR
ncbi:MAG: MFS transporter [Paracoccaceae bacterium]